MDTMFHGTSYVYHGIPLFTMVCHCLPWYTTIYHGISLFTMVYHGCTMVLFHKGPLCGSSHWDTLHNTTKKINEENKKYKNKINKNNIN